MVEIMDQRVQYLSYVMSTLKNVFKYEKWANIQWIVEWLNDVCA